MLICWNAEGVHGKKKVENPWYRVDHTSEANTLNKFLGGFWLALL